MFMATETAITISFVQALMIRHGIAGRARGTACKHLSTQTGVAPACCDAARPGGRSARIPGFDHSEFGGWVGL
jgi:hypothetical protein